MNNKLQQAQVLVSQNKYKKALPILKKINQKKAQQSYISLELEGVCLVKEKKYLLAELTLLESLNKAKTIEEKCNTLANLKSAAYSLNDQKRSITYLSKLVNLEPSQKTAELRLQLCQLSFLEELYDKVTEFAPKLFALSDYSTLALVIAIAAHAKLKQTKESLHLLNKLLPEIDKLSNSQAKTLLESLQSLGKIAQVNTILEKIEHKFSHEIWFKEIQQALSEISSSAKESSNKTTRLKQEKPKERVIGDNKATIEIINNLLFTLEEKGAKFHKDLRFIESNGNLSIKAYNNDNKQRLISTPVCCMPILSDFVISIEGDKIFAKPVASPINPDAIPVMELMIELYNETNKIKTWQSTYPLLALREYPEFLNKLFANTEHTVKQKLFKALYDKQQWSELTQKTFIGSREFYFKKELLNKSNIKTVNAIENGLLGVIDFLNHKEGAPGYLVNKKQGTLEIDSSSESSTTEVFVEYNYIDPVMSYLIYGFVDLNSSFLFSCITNLTCKTGLNIAVLGVVGRSSTQVPKDVSHIEQFLPATIKRSANIVTINNLVIPSKQYQHTLPQVLAYLLKKIDLEGLYNNEALLKEEVKHLEKQLLLNNLQYWNKLNNEFKQLTEKDKTVPDIPKQDIDNLCGFSINHINQYMKLAGVVLI